MSCSYYYWSDERGPFNYCETQDTPLSAEFRDDVHRFSESAQRQDTTAIKFVRAGKVDFIPDEVVTTYPKFEGFILESSDIPVLKNGLFSRKFAGVKFLEIQHNNLKEVQLNAFVNLPNMEWIRLASNQIEHIDVNIFNNNRKLKYIDLRNNAISSLTPSLCQGCRSLEEVLMADRNVCSQKNFMKSDGSLSSIAADLKTCYDNCRKSSKCDADGSSVSDPTEVNLLTCGQSKIGASLIVEGKEFPRGESFVR